MPRRPTAALLVALAFVPAVGCSGQPPQYAAKPTGPAAQAPPAPPAGGEAAPPAGPQGPAAPPPGVELPAERKIVFSGTLEVEVPDFAAARAEVGVLLKKYRAFFAKTEVSGDSGKKRSGSFTIKVPVENFQPLVEELAALGNPVKNATDSQDVTEEFVDVSARVKNLKAEEETLNRLLKDAAGRLDDVFKIREQIRQVRGDIERAEARVQALGKMAALSTITLTLRETAPYVAPTAPKPAEPPSFPERATGTWAASAGLLREVAEGLALFAVAAAPWLPVLLVAVAAGWWVARRAYRPAAPARPA